MSQFPIDKSMKVKESNLLKLLGALQKAISKEFLWILFAVLLSVPFAFIINYFIQHFASDTWKAIIRSETNSHGTFTGSYITAFAGIYFSRVLVGTIKTQLKSIATKK